MSIKKHIPNAITSMNLLCGVLGVICTLELDKIPLAFILMLAAACFDFLDGLAARLLGAYSEIGKELDSLSDLVSFGVLPSLMLHKTMTGAGLTFYLSLVPLLVAVFSALRLAKFNIDTRQHSSFLGLPTPSCAMICGSLACTVADVPEGLLGSICSTVWFIPVVAVILCALLVCEIPMFSFKFGSGEGKDFRTTLQRTAFLTMAVICVLIVVVMGLRWSSVVTLVFSCYVLVNLGFCMVPSLK